MTEMDAFFEDCGGRDPVRVELWPREGGASVAVEFRKPYVVVGRGRGADMGVANDGAAMRQLYLQLVGGRLYGVRLDEAHPTLRGDDAWRSGWVTPVDLFGVRETNLRVVNPVQGAPETPAAGSPLAARATGGPLYTLECGYGAGVVRPAANARPLLLIGRETPAKLRVSHPTVCPTHAAVVATPRGFWVVDLSYEGGVSVNGEAVSVAPLRHGDVFRCGRVPFRFLLPGQPEPSRPVASGFAAAAPGPLAPQFLGPAPGDPSALAVGTVLDQVAQVQQHSFEQFRQMLGTVMQMVSVVMADQRAFVKDELDRMERMMTAMARLPQPPAALGNAAALPSATPPRPEAPAAPAVPAPPARPSETDLHLHNWVENQMQTLQREQDTLWHKLKRTVGGGGPPPS